MFVVGNDVFVNELAPRPHNTGHYTLNVCTTSQFEQQVRAICGLGLGETRLLVPGVAMVNLLGEMWERGEPKWDRATASAAAHLHLYGKSEPRRGRKMGHLTVAAGTAMGAQAIAYRLRNELIAD
jgi:5-(carboxyamino)imidazole ribonucleotide synthase